MTMVNQNGIIHEKKLIGCDYCVDHIQRTQSSV